MRIQHAKSNQDWENFICAQINQEKKDFLDINLGNFFLSKLYENGKALIFFNNRKTENFDLELIASHFLSLKSKYQGAPNLKTIYDVISQFAELQTLSTVKL